ncbi:MAG: hypothetical protein E7212_04915 [Clostridium sartagoforme]|nr:hypothetical protein [Clostridium sartagoforme]
MENFLEFKNRIYSFQKNSISDNLQEFIVNPKIEDKVDINGSIKEFYGDTVVFELSKREKNLISKLQDILYANCNEYLSERLPSETFHMTLHDLNSNSNYKFIEDILIKSENDVKNVFDEISNINNNEPIIMKKSYIFNLVNTSIVLGLEPIDHESYSRLMCLYNKFEEVKELTYPLTPHITLAYFKDKNIDYIGIEILRKTIEEMNKYEVEINLKLRNLSYKYFYSMKKYKTILNINDK